MIALQEVKDHLRVTHDDEDALIAGYEIAAVEAIENWTGRFFGPTEEVTEEVYSGNGGDTIWLSETANPDTATITVETWNGTEWVAVEVADFTVDGFGLYHVTSYWPTGRRNIRVTYERGYAPGAEPWPIRQAVLLLVGHWYQNREPVAVGTIVAELPLSVKELIGPYKKVRI